MDAKIKDMFENIVLKRKIVNNPSSIKPNEREISGDIIFTKNKIKKRSAKLRI
jgi:hypothetical protein